MTTHFADFWGVHFSAFLIDATGCRSRPTDLKDGDERKSLGDKRREIAPFRR
jgi:hypothetical protein